MKNPIVEVHNYNSFEFIKPQDAVENQTFFCPDPKCPDPEKKLFLRRSSLGKKFFTHRVGNEHEIHPKTLLHKMVVSQFKKISKFHLPKPISDKTEIEIDHKKSIVEFRGIEGEAPDIFLVDKDGFECFLEVTISFPIDNNKLNAAKKRKLPLVEINIEKFFYENEENINDIDFLTDHASKLIKSASSKVVYNPLGKENIKQAISTKSVIGGAVLLGAAGIATYLSFKNR
jgi:hypothetical protein